MRLSPSESSGLADIAFARGAEQTGVLGEGADFFKLNMFKPIRVEDIAQRWMSIESPPQLIKNDIHHDAAIFAADRT